MAGLQKTREEEPVPFMCGFYWVVRVNSCNNTIDPDLFFSTFFDSICFNLRAYLVGP
jgi:hypothetical protein